MGARFERTETAPRFDGAWFITEGHSESTKHTAGHAGTVGTSTRSSVIWTLPNLRPESPGDRITLELGPTNVADQRSDDATIVRKRLGHVGSKFEPNPEEVDQAEWGFRSQTPPGKRALQSCGDTAPSKGANLQRSIIPTEHQ